MSVHTWESSEGVKINIPIRKASFCAVKSTGKQQDLSTLKQSFPLRTEIVVCMNFLKYVELLGLEEFDKYGGNVVYSAAPVFSFLPSTMNNLPLLQLGRFER